MKAAHLLAYGDIDQFKYEDAAEPSPGAGEVLIAVEASGLNPVDLYVRQGYLAQNYPMEMPAILGVDAAGTIIAVGAGVSGYATGERVVGHLPINGKGAHAEKAIVPLAGLAKLPANVDFVAGATLPLVGLTGRQVVAAGDIKAGERVLVTGALGAVGRVVVQALREIGAVPVAGVRAERLAEAKALTGEAIDINAATGPASFRVALDTVGGPVAANALKLVVDGGTLATCVQVPEGANPGERVKVASIWTHDDPKMLQAVADAAGRGELSIPVAKTFRLSELGEAHKALAAGHVGGKIVVTP